jgi:hypothetical protein
MMAPRLFVAVADHLVVVVIVIVIIVSGIVWIIGIVRR